MSYEKLPNLPKIVVKYPHRHESSARIHDSLQANAMHYENTCAERFIYKFSGDDVKQNWTKCTQTTTSFVSLLQGHARGTPPDAQEESELQVHERKHKCQPPFLCRSTNASAFFLVIHKYATKYINKEKTIGYHMNCTTRQMCGRVFDVQGRNNQYTCLFNTDYNQYSVCSA